MQCLAFVNQKFRCCHIISTTTRLRHALYLHTTGHFSATLFFSFYFICVFVQINFNLNGLFLTKEKKNLC